MNTYNKFLDKFIETGAVAGIVNYAFILVNILVVTKMWQRAGMPYNGVFTAVVLSSLLATAAAGVKYRLGVAVAPGIAVNSFLCYDLIICHGFTWQEAMCVPLVAGLLILFVVYTGAYHRLIRSLPGYLLQVIPGVIGVLLIYRGLIMGNLVIGTPVQITGMGSINDPIAIIAGVSTLVALILWCRNGEYGILSGLLTAVFFALVSGYMVLPEAWFSLPMGLMDTVLQVSTDRFAELIGAVLVVFLVLISEGMALAQVVDRDNEAGVIMSNGFASFLGGVIAGGAMSVSEASAACRFDSRYTYKPVWITVILLLVTLFCAPLLLEMADYGFISVSAVICAGCCLLQNLKFSSFNDNISILAGVFTLLLVPLWGSLTAGIGCGLLVYCILMLTSGRGSELSLELLPIVGLFVVYMIYGF
ncbi:MAG: hypothetical protein K6C05_10735 [Anaerovibrio sp.]|uniref:hypothetical protein n=1 Tax=Anaerovibrio sp. TaxID=1872532 RepID=UPI0025E20F76|nr:hypothetical protein [Anaerovibrio sp.]MCR5177302.1 hypothetical protein [Anaerovibrio sp.]